MGLVASTLAAGTLVACVSAPQTANQGIPTSTMHMAHAKPAAMPADVGAHGFAALEAMTFDCPKAGLNAAAREAGKVPSQGTYQFSYFNLVNDAHHSAYEVHFRSNYAGEPVLRYCVSLYCQQGWDPRTTQINVHRMNDERQDGGAQRAACGAEAGSRKRRPG